jgi:hypothetical protein
VLAHLLPSSTASDNRVRTASADGSHATSGEVFETRRTMRRDEKKS